jgi:hypothetical protein
MRVTKIRFCDLAVHDRPSPLQPRINLLPPGLNRCLDSGLLRGKGVGQVKLSFGHASAVVLFDGKLRRESAIREFV